jgi:phenylalanyl-tRNA synthetase beta chain
MRTTLLYGGLETIIFNVNRKRPNLRLYEFGNCYLLPEGADPEHPEGYQESERLALFATGPRNNGNWIDKEPSGHFFELKSFVEGILERVGLQAGLVQEQGMDAGYFTDGLTYTIKRETVARMGILDPSLTRQFEIPSTVFYADFDWSTVLKAMKGFRITMQEIPKFPEVRRDLSMIIDRAIPFSKIREIAMKSGKEWVKSVTLFDVYESEKLEKGKKSYAVGLILQDNSKTLTDKEIDRIMNRIQGNLEKQIHALIRQAT